MKFLLFLILTFLEFLFLLFVYALVLSFLNTIKFDIVTFQTNLIIFKFGNYLSNFFYVLTTIIMMESFKILALYITVVFTLNFLIFKNVIKITIYTAPLFLGSTFIFLSLIFDPDFLQYQNLSATINTFLTILIVSLFHFKFSIIAKNILDTA
jgi:hypothetical protein